jgi:hypothetical protein
MLHKDDDLHDAIAKIPQHVALPVNMRPVDTLSLGENCMHKDGSLVNKLRNEEEKKESILTFGGQYCAIFTSYEKSSNENPSHNTCCVMQSTSIGGCGGRVGGVHATFLTKEIINQGIKWLRGNAYAEKDPGSVADALQEYLNALKEVIPLQNPSELSLNHASDFIKQREWPDDSQEDRTSVLKLIEQYSRMESNSELSKACCLARRFIYKHLAKQTKIVAHAVDGIHRLTALECVLIGYQQPEEDDYAVRLPHAETSLAINAMVPTETELRDEDFINIMKDISSECQQSFGSLQPHSKKVFFAAMIRHLDELCKGGGGRRSPFFLMKMTTNSVENQIAYFAYLIIKVVRDKKHVQNYRMVPNMHLETLVEEKDEETWTNLFKNKNNKFSFLWDDGKFSLLNFIYCHSDIFNMNRYKRDGGFNAEVFELVQVLLWSRISQETYNGLINFFTTNRVSSTVTQVSASDKDGKMTDRWISGFLDTVTTSVYYSYKVINKAKKNSSKDFEILLMGLIKSAIVNTTDFFSEYGLDPSPPDWFKQVQEKMEDQELIMRAIGDVLETKGTAKEKNVNAISENFSKYMINNLRDNFVAFLRTAFAFYLQLRIFNKTRGRSNLQQQHLDNSLGKKRTIIVMEDTNQKWTACIKEYASKIARDQFSGERLEGNILLMTRHFIDSKNHVQSMKAKKYNKPVEEEVITTPEHQVMKELMTSIQSLKEADFPTYIEELISNNSLDEDTKDKAEKLVELFQKLFNKGSDESNRKDDDGDSSRVDDYF